MTLAQAVSASSNGSTITLLKDCTDTSGVSINKTLTFNKNGHTLTRTSAISLATNTTATLTVTGTGTITSSSNAFINNGTGSVIINGGEIKGTGTVSTINNASTGKVEVKLGTVSASNATTIHNETSGTITVSGGTVTSTGTNVAHRGIYNKAGGTVALTSGSVKTNKGKTIYNASTGKINITGGTITSNEEAIYMVKGTLTITTVTINSHGSCMYLNSGTSATVNNGSFTSTAYNAVHENGGDIKINGGTFAGNGTGVYVENSGGAMIKNSTIIGNANNPAIQVAHNANIECINSTLRTAGATAIINHTDQGGHCIIRSRAANFGVTGGMRGYVIATTNTGTGQSSETVRIYNAATTGVMFAVWTTKNGQDDLIWSSTTKTSNYNQFIVYKSAHNNETGEYAVHMYDSADGSNARTPIGGTGIYF